MDAGGAEDESADLRTAKSCGPDAPTLASSLPVLTCRRPSQTSPVTGERALQAVEQFWIASLWLAMTCATTPERRSYSWSGFLPPMVLSLANTASTLRSSRCFSVGSNSLSLRVVSEAGSKVAPP